MFSHIVRSTLLLWFNVTIDHLLAKVGFDCSCFFYSNYKSLKLFPTSPLLQIISIPFKRFKYIDL